MSNPLYSFVLATGVEHGTTFQSLIKRFFDINRQLKRLEVVRALCVLGHGCVIWGFKEGLEIRPALFMLKDLYLPIIPAYFDTSRSGSALYVLVENLALHLYHSVLAPEDLVTMYGRVNVDVDGVVPDSDEIRLDPDPEWLEFLDHPCTPDEDLAEGLGGG